MKGDVTNMNKLDKMAFELLYGLVQDETGKTVETDKVTLTVNHKDYTYIKDGHGWVKLV